MKGNLLKIIAACSISINTALLQVFSAIFSVKYQKLLILFKILPVHFNKSLCTVQIKSVLVINKLAAAF